MESFTYPTLADTNHFRVLTLECGRGDDPIKCHLDVLHTQDAARGQYEAVSYAWGSSVRSSYILCHNERLQVTSTLRIALAHLRSDTHARKLWIDQICINQGDLRERSAQVPIMGTIYRCAARVVVWLGEKDDTSDAALTFASDLCHNLSLYSSVHRKDQLGLSDLGRRIDGTDFILPAEQSPDWTGLARLLNREWFQRLWVVQEAALNPNTIVCCGSSQVPWSVFIQLSMHLDRQSPLISLLTVDGKIVPGLHLAGSLIGFGHTQDARDVLKMIVVFSKQLVTDPRDRIYAILSLVDDSKGGSVTANYELDIRNVYTSFAHQCIENGYGLNVLHYVETGDARQSPDVPSWVPDWRIRPHARELGTEYISREIFSASQSKPATFEFGPQGETLLLKGRMLGTQESHGILFPTVPFIDENLHVQEFKSQSSMINFFDTSMQFARSCHYPTQESANEILCHTFSRDYYRVAYPAKDGLASAVDLLNLYRESIRDGVEILRKYFATPEDSWIRRRFYDTSSLRVRLWWLLHLNHIIRRAEERPDIAENSQAISTLFAANLRGNRIVTTTMGFLANVPSQSIAGDEIWVLYGCKTPFILRQTPRGHLLIGECFVHGIMYGEAIEQEMGVESDVVLI
ncbi:hypothetical protein MMC15_003311 [Xylographa vitiligo]|nr:hypothetical protein [Xylographa vitiligo]